MKYRSRGGVVAARCRTGDGHYNARHDAGLQLSRARLDVVRVDPLEPKHRSPFDKPVLSPMKGSGRTEDSIRAPLDVRGIALTLRPDAGAFSVAALAGYRSLAAVICRPCQRRLRFSLLELVLTFVPACRGFDLQNI